MLNGLDPIILFHFYKDLVPYADNFIGPVPADVPTKAPLPPIPIYLSESLTGIYIESEDKSIEIDTTTDSLKDGSDPIVNQKAVGTTTRINLIASRDSTGLTLLLAMADLIVPKVTSKDYAITYLHGAVTIFNGLLHSFSVQQNSDNELYRISIEISKGASTGTNPVSPTPTIPRITGVLPV
jgi:hypothetical protein